MVPWFIGAMTVKLLVLAAIILGIYKLVVFVDSRRARRLPQGSAGSRRAVGIARERYASGEIDEQEYRRILEVLGSPAGGG